MKYEKFYFLDVCEFVERQLDNYERKRTRVSFNRWADPWQEYQDEADPEDHLPAHVYNGDPVYNPPIPYKNIGGDLIYYTKLIQQVKEDEERLYGKRKKPKKLQKMSYELREHLKEEKRRLSGK